MSAESFKDKIERIAACGTVDSWLELSDHDLRLWFANSLIESSLKATSIRLLEDAFDLISVIRVNRSRSEMWPEAYERLFEDINEFLGNLK